LLKQVATPHSKKILIQKRNTQNIRMDLRIFERKQTKGHTDQRKERNGLAAWWWKTKKSKQSKSLESAPGAFCSAIPRAQNQARFLSARSDKTDATWKVCDSESYHDHSPLLAHRMSGRDLKVSDEATELGMVMARARKLPGTWYFSNNIILVNQSRCRRNAPALSRDMELDHIARLHAQAMATSGKAEHSDSNYLRFKLSGPCRRIGENVAVGTSIKDIHKEMMESTKRHADKNNVLDRRYTCMGVGTAKGEDGTLYLCQIFKG
jgi:hypothetical protein